MLMLFSQEREEFRQSVRGFLRDTSPEPEVRRLMATADGYDRAVWQRMAAELGLQGLAVPEEHGGSGYGFNELAVVFEEMGRVLLCAPYFSTVGLALNALLVAGDQEAQRELLPGIASGETVATLALTEDSGRWDAGGVALTASPAGTLTGHKSYVVDGHVATLILVVARTGDGYGVFAVDGDARGLTRTPLVTLDQTRKQARLEFVDTPARMIGPPGDTQDPSGQGAGTQDPSGQGTGWSVIARILDRAAVVLAAEQAGGAQRCLELAGDYANQRVQFGREIGSFQAIKHKCANMLIEVESAKSAAYYAAWAAADEPDELALAAPMAKAYCSDAFFHAAADTIQIHGGIGFTWEHPAHLYFRRAKTSELLLGDPAYHRELLAQRLTAGVS